MAAADKASADSKRDSAARAERSADAGASRVVESDTPLAPGQAALRERLGNRAFGGLMQRASGPPPTDPSQGPFTNSAAVRVAAFDDPLERDAERAIDAPSRPSRRAQARPNLLSPLDAAATSALRSISGPGAPLDSSLRVDAERRLGVHLPAVRLFRTEAPLALGTRAFAYGTDVFVSPNAPAPSTPAGRALVLHELAHVHQQQLIGQPFIQREPPTHTTDGDWEIDTYSTGYQLRTNKKEHKVEIVVGGKTWIQMSAPKSTAMPKVVVAWGSSSVESVTVAEKVGIMVQTEADITITVDQNVEDEVFKRLQGRIAAIVYKFSGGGTATFTSTGEETFATREGQLAFGPDGKPVKVQVESSRDFALPMTMTVTEDREPPRLNSDAPIHPPPVRSEQITIDKLPNSFPTFQSPEQVKKFLESQPTKDFVVLQMPDGQFVARAVDEQQMKALAQSIREGRTKLGGLPDLRRYNGKAASGKFLTFWLHGKEYASPDAIRDLYYFNEAMADVGTSDGPPECEVYRMGTNSFGRRPLTHTEAVMLLKSFDKMSKDEVYKRQVEGFPFFSMRFQGKAELHIVDERYFEGREKFKTNAVKYQEAIKQGTSLDVRRGPFDALNSLEVEHFLGIELDREQDNPEFIALLKGAESALRLVAKFVWRQVTHHANYVATREIAKGIETLKPYQDDQMLRGVVLTFATLNDKQKRDTLNFLGVETTVQYYWSEALSDRSTAWRIAQGQTDMHARLGALSGRGPSPPPPTPISLDLLRGFVKSQLDNLGKTIDALKSVGSDGEYEFNAISASGEFGEQVRTITYRDLHLSLDPKKWPHGNVSPGWFPSPLEGDRSNFGSTFEQIYANESNSHDSWDVVKLIVKVTLMAVVAVIIILIAHVFAAAVVAALGLEGIAAFAVYTGVNAAILTGAEVLQAKLIEGKNPTLAGVIQSFIKNLVMVGGFTKFGKALEGVSSVARTGIMGATFLGISLVERLGSGGFSSPRDFFMWFYENIVMFAALEAGGQLIRPLDVRIQFWGRARRLGILVPEIDGLTGDIGKLQNRLADLMQTPHRANLEAPKLQAESRRLLELQKDLAKQVAAKVKDTNDPEAKFVADELKKELESVDQALAAMQEADFLLALQISPAGDAPNVFEYKPSANAVEAITKFFPKDTKVEASSDGVIRVTIPGHGDPFVLYPEGHAKLPVPKKGSIESRLNLNSATAEDIVNAEIPGIGKDTAEKIVEGRKEKGGTFDSFDDLLKIKDIGPKTVEKLKASGKVEVAPKEKVNVIETQKALADRIDAIVARARRLNIKDKAIDALAKKQIGSFEEDLLKDRAEIDKVDKALEDKIRKAGAKARKRYEKRKTTPKDWLAQVKVERLAGVSDEVINEALSQIPSGKKSRVTQLGPRQIRAIVLAHMEGAPVRRFLETGKDFTVAERNRALDLYLDAAEHRIKGAGRVLAEMSLQASKFRGGLFVLDVAERFGFANIKEFEMPARLGDNARFVDMVLKGDSIWVECKDWAEWERNNPAKLASQFRRDIILREYDASAFKKLRYVFRKPAPRPVADIKAFLREALVVELNEARAADVITAQRQQDLLKAFDDEADLVAETGLRDEHTLLPPDPSSAKPSTIAPIPPPVPADDDEDDDEGDE